MITNDSIKHLDNVLLENNSFEFGKYFSEGTTIWKNNFGAFLGFSFLYVIIIFSLSMIPIIGQIASSVFVTPALSLGGVYAAYRLDLFKDNNFEQFFHGFKFFLPILIVALITLMVFIALALPLIPLIGIDNLGVLFSGDPDLMREFNLKALGIFCGVYILLAMFIAVLFSYAYYFIGIYNLSGIDAIKYSFKFGMKHWFMIFLFNIVLALLICSGLILLIIGVFLTFSMFYPILYSSFKGMTKLESFIKEENIEDHLVDF